MNQSQIKYAKERLAQIKRKREGQIGSIYSAGLSLEEKKELVLSGQAYIEIKNDTFAIRFPGDEEKKAEVREKLRRLNEEYEKVMDELVLGDAEEAVCLLNNFDKGENN